MRVAYLIDDISAPGGAQKMAVQLAEETASDPGRSITLVSLERATNDELDDRLRQQGVDVRYFPGSNLVDPMRFRRLVGFLRSSHFDLVHTNLVYANILGTVAARLARIPSVGGLRNVYLANDAKDGLRHRLEGRVLRSLARAAMAVGPSTADAHRSRLSGLRIVPIPNPLELPQPVASATRRRVRSDLGVGAESTLVIAVGTLRHTKGYTDLVEAFSIVLRDHVEAVLVIVGEGPERPVVESAIAAAGVGDGVRLLGHRDDVGELLGAVDVYVNSSHAEGLSNAILEAMGAGLPVIVTDVGDSAVVVGDAAGIVVPAHEPRALASAIEKLLAAPEERRACGAAGRERIAQNHSVGGWVDAMFGFYQGVIGDERRGAHVG